MFVLAPELPIGSIVVPFWGLPYRILQMNPKKELLWSLWVKPSPETVLESYFKHLRTTVT